MMCRTFFVLMCIGIVCVVQARPFFYGDKDNHTLKDQKRLERSGLNQLKLTGKAFTSVAKSVAPAVVFIQIEQQVSAPSSFQDLDSFSQHDFFKDSFFDDFFDRSFGNPMLKPHAPFTNRDKRPEKAIVKQGSGFIISDDGYILTNSHVVGDADRIKVTLADGRVYRAVVIGTDDQSDVAVIKIEEMQLPFVSFADSDHLEVGEWVLAIGNPFGLSNSLTAGIVSAVGRNQVGISNYENFIQTDAAINPGNSGGPLLNLEGQVVGMSTAIFSRSGGYMGIGFAIPSNMINAISKQLIKKGSVIRGYLGVYVQALSDDLVTSFKMSSRLGVLVAHVHEHSPAEASGMRHGDVLVYIGGKKIVSVADFRNQIALLSPGTRVFMQVLRDGRELDIKVMIGQKQAFLPSLGQNIQTSSRSFGVDVATLTPALKQRYRVSRDGVVITAVSPRSLANQVGLKEGMVILQVNRRSVSDAETFTDILSYCEPGALVLLWVQDRGIGRYVAFDFK